MFETKDKRRQRDLSHAPASARFAEGVEQLPGISEMLRGDGPAVEQRASLVTTERSRTNLRRWLPLALLLAWLTLSQTEAVAQLAAPIPLGWRRDATLWDVQFIDAQRGWACGDHGTLLRTEDGGQTWYTSETGVQCRLESVSFIDAQRGWVAGGYELPGSHRRVAVLLATTDGGVNWFRIETSNLPWFHRIKFVDEQDGFAVGDVSALHQSGVFITRDGGLNWSTLSGVAPMGWTDGDTPDRMHFSLVGDREGAFRLNGTDFDPAPLLTGQAPQLLAVRYSPTGTGWAVGERGLVLRSPDQGTTWRESLDRKLLPGIDQVEWRTIATQGNSIWIAGHPGSLLLHSHDQGQSWEVSHTGAIGDINGLSFIDETTGWAVGSLGRVGVTYDGGRSWLWQRNVEARTMVTLIASDPTQIPPELICFIGAQEGWHLEVVTPQAGLGPAHGKSTFRSGFEQWNAIVGAVGTSWWTVPHRGLYAPPLTDFDREALAERLSVTAQQEDWKRYLALYLRSRTPDIVLVPAPQHANPFEGDKRLHDLAIDAIKRAGLVTEYPEQLKVIGLRPWGVSKTMSWSSREGRSGLQVLPNQFALALGRTLADQSLAMRFDQNPGSIPDPPRFQVQLLDTTLPVSVARDSIGGGILPDRARGGRRLEEGNARGTYQQITRLARVDEVHRELLALAENPANDPRGSAWIASVERQIVDLDLWSAGNWIVRLALAHEEKHQNLAAARAYRLMLDRYPDHPLADSAALWLWNYYSSLEWQWNLSPEAAEPFVSMGNGGIENSSAFTFDEALRAISAQEEQALQSESEENQNADNSASLANASPPSQAALNRFNRDDFIRQPIRPEELAQEMQVFIVGDAVGANAAGSTMTQLPFADLQQGTETQYLAALEGWIRTNRPVLALDWRFQCRGAFAPSSIDPGQWLNLSEFDASFSEIARVEAWLQEPLKQPAPAERLSPSLITSGPVLDGRLDEPFWIAAIDEGRFAAPRSEDRSNQASTSVLFARDDEFLYVAAICQRHPELAYPPPPGPRLRDERPSDVDHLVLWLDPDRDRRTAYQLVIDHRGRAWEGVNADPSWDPQWFVASQENERTWTIEAAIPLQSLGVKNGAAMAWWGLGVERVCPGFTTRQWGMMSVGNEMPGGEEKLILGLLQMPLEQPPFTTNQNTVQVSALEPENANPTTNVAPSHTARESPTNDGASPATFGGSLGLPIPLHSNSFPDR